MKLKSILSGNFMFINFFACLAIVILLTNLKSGLASECPHSNFMVVDGKCINLDPQMKTKEKTKVDNPLSEVDELTGSSLATYASLLSLVAGGTAGYKFLVRK